MSDIIATDGRFSEEHRQVLSVLFDMMIPAVGPMPSAADPNIARRTLAELSDHAELVTEALTALGELVSKSHQQSIDALDRTQRAVIVETFKPLRPAFIQILQAQTIASYYQDDRVLLALGLPTRSPHPGGYEVPATDWSLLDPVRARKPFYRQTGGDNG